MKNAAKRDINCELQNSVSHRNFERITALGFTLSYASLSIVTQKLPTFELIIGSRASVFSNLESISL